jgi:hypothetical protein
VNIKHCDFLSWFSRKEESHEQDGERLMFALDGCDLHQHLAILPWPSVFRRCGGTHARPRLESAAVGAAEKWRTRAMLARELRGATAR